MTRCKFLCSEVIKRVNGAYGFVDEKGNKPPFLFVAKFHAVTGTSEENKKFFAWTPSGNVEIGVYHHDIFIPGKEYYLDITEAPKETK